MSPAQLLARAFHHDPFLAWADPDEARRGRTLAAVFEPLLASALRHQACILEPGVGSVDWKAPGHLRPGAWEILRLGFWRVATVAPPAVWRRLASHEAAAMAVVGRHLGPRAAYLGTLGVEPSLAGQGHGGRLLRRALAAMVAARWTSCVLRTEQPRNVPFYLRHGFRLVEEVVALPSALRVWVFERPLPVPASALDS